MPKHQEKPGKPDSSGNVFLDAFSGLTPEVLQNLLMNALQGGAPPGVDIKVKQENILAQVAGALLTPGPEDVLKIAGLPFFSRMFGQAKQGARASGKALDIVADQFDPTSGTSANLLRSFKSNRPAQIQREVDEILALAQKSKAEEALTKVRPAKGGLAGYTARRNLKGVHLKPNTHNVTFEPKNTAEGITSAESTDFISQRFDLHNEDGEIGTFLFSQERGGKSGSEATMQILDISDKNPNPQELMNLIDESFEPIFDQALKMADGDLSAFNIPIPSTYGTYNVSTKAFIDPKPAEDMADLLDAWMLKTEARLPDHLIYSDGNTVRVIPKQKVEELITETFLTGN